MQRPMDCLHHIPLVQGASRADMFTIISNECSISSSVRCVSTETLAFSDSDTAARARGLMGERRVAVIAAAWP
jgi:hypothetical protein